MQLAMALPDPAPTTECVDLTPLVQLRREGELMLVSVSGTPWAYFDREDQAARSYAMVSLVRGGLARVTAVAQGFRTNRVQIYRFIERYEQGGMAALVPLKRGPKGPRVLKDQAGAVMKALKRQGVPNTEIARRLGVSESGVRYELGKLGVPGHRAKQLSFPVADAPAEQPESEAIAEPEPTPQPEPAPEPASSLTDLPQPVPHGTEQAWDRTDDRIFARLGLLPEALPRFGPAQGVRGAGRCWPLLRWRLLACCRRVGRCFRAPGPPSTACAPCC